MEIVVVDVSELEPPEPMSVILAALSRLKEGNCLVVKHRRQPFPLYEKLLEQSWIYHCQVHSDDDISLYICRESNRSGFEQLLQEKGITLT